MVLVFQILFGLAFGMLGFAAWRRVAERPPAKSLLNWLLAALVGAAGCFALGWLASFVGDPYVSRPLGGIVGGGVGGMVFAALRGALARPSVS